MDLQPHILTSSGSFAVAVIALFFSVIQVWLYCIRREERWHLWGMLISLATTLFAIGVFLQYHSEAGELNRFADKLQYSAIIFLVHFAYGFTYSYLGLRARRNYHLPATLFHGLLLILLWNTCLIIGDTFINREFLLLDQPYVEARLGFIGILMFLYVAFAITCLILVLVRHVRAHGARNNLYLYIAGFIFWLLLGIHDLAVTLFNLKALIFLMEYGFLGYSIAVTMVIMKNNIELSVLTENRAMHLALEKERYAAISQVIFDYAFAFRVGSDGRFIADWVVGPIEKLTGYTATELSDFRTRKNFIHPEDWPLIRAHTRRLLEGKSETIEFRIRTKTGQQRWMRNHGRAVFDPVENRTTYIYGAMQDVTERKSAEEALRENEKKYRLLVENANDAIFIIQNERIIFPNPRTIAMTGYTADELAEIGVGQLVHPDDRQMVLHNNQKRLRDENVPHTYAFRIITPRKQVRNVQINAVRIEWSGKPATLNFIRDITTEKKLEDQLQQKKTFEAIGILAGGLSHDINNALTGMLGNIELMRFKFQQGLLNKENINHHMIPILSSIERVTEQCRKLLAYARGGKYLPQLIVLNDTLRDVLNAADRSRFARIAFTTEFEALLPEVRADSGQMRMMVDAVLQNAIESITGPGEIRIRTGNAVLGRVPGQEISPGQYVEIIIEDTGVGMDEETLSKIFDPFFTTKFHGRGMSLAAVYGIIKNHQGAIQVDSAPGRGTTVRIHLPCERPAEADGSGTWSAGPGAAAAIAPIFD